MITGRTAGDDALLILGTWLSWWTVSTHHDAVVSFTNVWRLTATVFTLLTVIDTKRVSRTFIVFVAPHDCKARRERERERDSFVTAAIIVRNGMMKMRKVPVWWTDITSVRVRVCRRVSRRVLIVFCFLFCAMNPFQLVTSHEHPPFPVSTHVLGMDACIVVHTCGMMCMFGVKDFLKMRWWHVVYDDLVVFFTSFVVVFCHGCMWIGREVHEDQRSSCPVAVSQIHRRESSVRICLLYVVLFESLGSLCWKSAWRCGSVVTWYDEWYN